MIATFFGKALEIRELSLCHEAIRQLRVLAVEADHDQPSDLRLGQVGISNKAHGGPERPEQEREKRDQPADEEDQEGGDEHEPRAGSHVRGEWRRGGGEEEESKQSRNQQEFMPSEKNPCCGNPPSRAILPPMTPPFSIRTRCPMRLRRD